MQIDMLLRVSVGTFEAKPRANEHTVKFYAGDEDFVTAVAGFLAPGFHAEELVVAVATRAHLALIEDELERRGIDPASAIEHGRYLRADAQTLLSRCMADGGPDRQAFMSTIRPLLDRPGRSSARRHVFGEMVALLWDNGDVAGAVALESMWNSLQQEIDFDLLCAYPAPNDEAYLAATSVCELHLEPISPSWPKTGSGAARCSRGFAPSPEAVADARRFVACELDGRVDTSVVESAVLVVSELATNAVRHARSYFSVSLEYGDNQSVRLSVYDVDERMPVVVSHVARPEGGRGIALVSKLATRWGAQPRRCGKAVWAEFSH